MIKMITLRFARGGRAPLLQFASLIFSLFGEEAGALHTISYNLYCCYHHSITFKSLDSETVPFTVHFHLQFPLFIVLLFSSICWTPEQHSAGDHCPQHFVRTCVCQTTQQYGKVIIFQVRIQRRRKEAIN